MVAPWVVICLAESKNRKNLNLGMTSLGISEEFHESYSDCLDGNGLYDCHRFSRMVLVANNKVIAVLEC